MSEASICLLSLSVAAATHLAAGGSGDQLVGSKGIDPFPNLKLRSHIKAVTLYGVPVGHAQGWFLLRRAGKASSSFL